MKKPYLFQSVLALGMIVPLFAGTPVLAGSVAESILKSRHLLADKGNVDAQYKLGSMYELGIGTEKNLAMASNFYAKAASKGSVKAKNRLRYLEVRKNGFDKQIHGGWLKQIKKDAKKGDSQAAMILGQLHSYGLGVEKDLDESIRMFNKANLNNPVILFEMDRVEKERKKLASLELKKKKAQIKQEARKSKKQKQIVKVQEEVVEEPVDRDSEARRKAEIKRRIAEYRRKAQEEERLIAEQQAWAEREEAKQNNAAKASKAAKTSKPAPEATASKKDNRRPEKSSRYKEMMRKLREEERILNEQQAWAEKQ